MIFVTGDAHAALEKFYKNQYKMLTDNDIVVVAGDFGFIWNGSQKEERILDYLSKLKFQIYFVDGNHENFDLLYAYPIVNLHGGHAGKIRDNIYHLIRGEVYLIDKYKIFVMGGAISPDKQWRKEYISWWSQEVPNYVDIQNGIDNLEKYNWEVDYVISHELPQSVVAPIYGNNEVSEMLEMFNNKLKYKIWYAGHYHIDTLINDKYQILYSGIIPLGEVLCDTSEQNF